MSLAIALPYRQRVTTTIGEDDEEALLGQPRLVNRGKPLILHDNARSNIGKTVVAKIHKMQFSVIHYIFQTWISQTSDFTKS